MLQITQRDGSLITNITEYEYASWILGGENSVKIFKHPQYYTNKIIKVYDEEDGLIDTAIIKDYSRDENLHEGSLETYPLLVDLQQGFFYNATGKVVYVNGDLADVIEQVITQYRADVANPLLYIKSKELTGKVLKYTFSFKSRYEVIEKIVSHFLGENFFYIDSDGGVVVGKTLPEEVVTYGNELKSISYEKKQASIVNSIIFDNVNPDPAGKIYVEWNDASSIASYGKRVKYIKDSRVKHIETANRVIETASKTSPDIHIQDIILKKKLPLFTKIKIQNFSDTFTNNIITQREYLREGSWKFSLSDFVNRKYYFKSLSDAIEQTSQEVQEMTNNAELKNPDYIKETFIDSTTIQSPTIAGNNGYFSGILKVGTNGIVINGPDKTIRSGAFDYSNKQGWKLWDDGKFLFGRDNNNYFEYDGTDFIFHGNIVAGANSTIQWQSVEGAGTPENNATVGADWNSNLANIPASATASYITSTKITSTTIESPVISGNNGYFSGVVKVGTNGIIIDAVSTYPNIRSSNFNGALGVGWIIDNDGHAEFNDIFIRGEIGTASIKAGEWLKAVSGSDEIRIGVESGTPKIKFKDGGTNVGELIGDKNHTVYIGGGSYTASGIKTTDDFIVGGSKMIVQNSFIAANIALFASGLTVWGTSNFYDPVNIKNVWKLDGGQIDGYIGSTLKVRMTATTLYMKNGADIRFDNTTGCRIYFGNSSLYQQGGVLKYYNAVNGNTYNLSG